MTPKRMVTSVSDGRNGRRRVDISEPSFGVLLNTPTLLLITALMFYPILASLWGSLHFQRLRLGSVPQFVGYKNYADILGREEFWEALRVSAVFGGATLVA